jgi:hypothetical protein
MAVLVGVESCLWFWLVCPPMTKAVQHFSCLIGHSYILFGWLIVCSTPVVIWFLLLSCKSWLYIPDSPLLSHIGLTDISSSMWVLRVSFLGSVLWSTEFTDFFLLLFVVLMSHLRNYVMFRYLVVYCTFFVFDFVLFFCFSPQTFFFLAICLFLSQGLAM